MQWQTLDANIRCNGQSHMNQYYAQQGDRTLYATLYGGGICESLKHTEVNHIAITISRPTDVYRYNRRKESKLSYSQKLSVLQELGKWKEVAVEIFPPNHEVIGLIDVSHLWELIHIRNFCVDVKPIFELPTAFELRFEGTRYHFETKQDVTYLYFEGKDSMSWKEKQRLKNLVTTHVSTGVEFICEAMANADYGCIVVLPPFQSLDFGLTKPLKK